MKKGLLKLEADRQQRIRFFLVDLYASMEKNGISLNVESQEDDFPEDGLSGITISVDEKKWLTMMHPKMAELFPSDIYNNLQKECYD